MVGAFAGAELALSLQAANLLLAMPPLVYVILAVAVGMAVSGLLAVTVERPPSSTAQCPTPRPADFGRRRFLLSARMPCACSRAFTAMPSTLTFPSLPAFDRRIILGTLATAGGGTIDVGISVKVIVFIGAAIITADRPELPRQRDQTGNRNSRRGAGSFCGRADGNQCQSNHCADLSHRRAFGRCGRRVGRA